MNAGWVKPIISIKDVEKLKRTIKAGDKFTYKLTEEKLVVVKVFPYIIQVERVKKPKRGFQKIRTMSFVELLFNNRGLTYSRVEQEEAST